jgi:hypothetical protein
VLLNLNILNQAVHQDYRLVVLQVENRIVDIVASANLSQLYAQIQPQQKQQP